MITLVFIYPCVILFLLLFIIKIITFISTHRNLKSRNIGDEFNILQFNKKILLLENHLDKFLWIFPLVAISVFTWLLLAFCISTHFAAAKVMWDTPYDTILPILQDMQQRSFECVVGTRIVLLYGLAWIFFSRWKTNIIRKFKLKYYKSKNDLLRNT